MSIQNNYKAVIGSFRIKRISELIDIALDNPGDKFLIDTGVSYNNDHILRGLDEDRFDIMTKFSVTDHLDGFDYYLQKHLQWLGRDKIQYALVHFYEVGFETLVHKLLDAPEILNVGVSNFNIYQLVEFEAEFGVYPKINQIEFSVVYHDEDLIQFCQDHDIEVLGYGVLNGIHNSKITKRSFTTTAAISFAILNEVVPILRSDYLDHLKSDLNAVINPCPIIGLQSEDLGSGFSYEVGQDVQDSTRALNKYKYNAPILALQTIVQDHPFMSFEESSEPALDIAYIARSTRIDPLVQLKDYLEIDYSHMMVTDYLVRHKYENWSPEDTISSYDDKMYNYTESKLVSYVILDINSKMVKSGMQGQRVFRQVINLLLT